MASRGRRVTRLRRPLLFVITPWVCGGFFVLVGAVTVVDAGGGSGVDLAASVAIGLGVGSVGAWFAYAFGWVPRMRIVVDALEVRELADRSPVRVHTRRVPRHDIAAVQSHQDEHHTVPLRVEAPVIGLVTGETIELDGHRGYVKPWRDHNARVRRLADTIEAWRAAGDASPR